jgi:hypothetical protein
VHGRWWMNDNSYTVLIGNHCSPFHSIPSPFAFLLPPYPFMDTYPPRTLEQFHACTRQRQKINGENKNNATAPSNIAAINKSKSVGSVVQSASNMDRADGRKPKQLRSTCSSLTTTAQQNSYAICMADADLYLVCILF